MARKRPIDPAIMVDEAMAALPLGARVLYIGMVLNADDEGRLSGSAKELKYRVFPADILDAGEVEAWTLAIHRSGLIRCHVVAGKTYVAISGWDKHQKARWPVASKVPAPTPEGIAEYERTQTGPANDTNARLSSDKVITQADPPSSPLLPSPPSVGVVGPEHRLPTTRAASAAAPTSGALFDIPIVPPRVAKPKKATDPRIATVKTAFTEAHGDHFGVEYVLTDHKRAGGQIATALKALGGDDPAAEMIALIPAYLALADADQFFAGAPLEKFCMGATLTRLRTAAATGGKREESYADWLRRVS